MFLMRSIVWNKQSHPGSQIYLNISKNKTAKKACVVEERFESQTTKRFCVLLIVFAMLPKGGGGVCIINVPQD